jgi:UDP-glucuronate 4-epimerase
VSELVALLESATGRAAKIDRRPLQAGDVKRTFADISRARSLLGYAPKVQVKEGIPKFVEWYRKHAVAAMTAGSAR